MPWIALRNGTPVAPQEADKSDTLICPECDEEMYVRGPYTRSDGSFVARHFSHTPDTDGGSAGSGDCPGESDEHERMKSIALSKARHVFGDAIERIDTEMQVGSSRRSADVGVVFADDIDTHPAIADANIDGAVGDRLGIEAQYRNKSKDIEGTEREYAIYGFSTLWLDSELFSSHDVDLFDGEWAPVYPTVLAPEVAGGAEPRAWCHPTNHIGSGPGSATVPAAFPPAWFADKLRAHFAEHGPGKQYERWATAYPELAEEFVDLGEDTLRAPREQGKTLLNVLYPGLDPDVTTGFFGDGSLPASEAVCGNCRHSEDDEFRDADEAIICWENQPSDDSRRPRKLTINDEFASDCPHFWFDAEFNEELADRMALHRSLQSVRFLKKLSGARGVSTRDRRKAALKFAYYQTWGHEPWNNLSFSPAREEAMLRYFDSPVAVAHEKGCATKGETVLPTDESAPADGWEPIESREDLERGHIYAIPPHGCVGAKAWAVVGVSDNCLRYTKGDGGSVEEIVLETRFDEPIPTADPDGMPLEELIRRGHVYHRGASDQPLPPETVPEHNEPPAPPDEPPGEAEPDAVLESESEEDASDSDDESLNEPEPPSEGLTSLSDFL